MTSRDYYQSRAIQVVKVSETLRDPTERKKLLEVALGYVALARYVSERQHHATAHRDPQHHPDQHLDDA